MILRTLHDLSDTYVTALLESGLSDITDSLVIKNYHPDYRDTPGNLFYILENGRYSLGKGTYYIVENNREFVCSAGWNEYDLDTDIALILTRMYVAPKYRVNYHVANYILPEILNEVIHYKHIWATVNEYNRALYEWFVRDKAGKRTALFNDWPDIYRKFRPIGKKTIYYTEQYIIEYQHELHS